MKNLLLIFISMFALVSCVDKDFDLGDINDDDITFGNEFIVPIGRIELKLSDVLDFSNASKAASVEVSLQEEFEDSFKLSGGFDQGIVDALTSSGTQSVVAEVKHTIPAITLLLNVSFFNGEEETKIIADEKLSSVGGVTSLSVNVTTDMLNKVATADRVLVRFKVKEGAGQVVSVNPDDVIEVNLKLKRTGGLKL